MNNRDSAGMVVGVLEGLHFLLFVLFSGSSHKWLFVHCRDSEEQCDLSCSDSPVGVLTFLIIIILATIKELNK